MGRGYFDTYADGKCGRIKDRPLRYDIVSGSNTRETFDSTVAFKSVFSIILITLFLKGENEDKGVENEVRKSEENFPCYSSSIKLCTQ